MSRSKPVGFGAGAEFWAYDAALAVLLAQVVDNVAAGWRSRPPGLGGSTELQVGARPLPGNIPEIEKEPQDSSSLSTR